MSNEKIIAARAELNRLVTRIADAHYTLGRQEALGGITASELKALRDTADALVDQIREEIDEL